MAPSTPQPADDAPDLVPLAPGAASHAAAIVALDAAGLPTEDVCGDDVQLYALHRAGRPVAFGGLQGGGADRLLRSVVTPPEQRGRGYGAAVVRELLALAAQAGAQRVWLLTMDASAFFDGLGFRAASRDDAPASIRAVPQFESLCPASAALMWRSLSAMATEAPAPAHRMDG